MKDSSKKLVCLYHADCTDGAGAALAVWLRRGGARHIDDLYLPVQYNEPVPGLAEGGLDGACVYIVDFSYPLTELMGIALAAESLCVIDHHSGVKDTLLSFERGVEIDYRDNGAAASYCPAQVIFDQDASGAALAWRHCYPGAPLPLLFEYLQDRDLWTHRFDHTNEVVAGLAVWAADWRDWEALVGRPGLIASEVRPMGRAIHRFIRNEAEKVVRSQGPRVFELTGDLVPLYNLPKFMASDTLALALERYQDSHYAVAFRNTGATTIFELRSRPGSDVDVSAIARPLGGNGHKHAAGFIASAEQPPAAADEQLIVVPRGSVYD